MDRRKFISICSVGLASVAGCSSTNNSDNNTNGGASYTNKPSYTEGTENKHPSTTQQLTTSQKETSKETSTEETDPTVSVSFGALQPAVVELGDDVAKVDSSAGQFLFLDVQVTSGKPLSVDDFTFEFGGKTYSPDNNYRTPYSYSGIPYRQKSGSGWLLFELPDSGDSSDSRLTWDRGSWQPSESVRRRLSTPFPDLSISVSLPNTVTEGEAPTISATAKNNGEYSTQFVATLVRRGGIPSTGTLDVVKVMVEPNSAKTWEYTDEYVADTKFEGVGDSEPDFTYHLDWPGGSQESEVRVVDRPKP